MMRTWKRILAGMCMAAAVTASVCPARVLAGEAAAQDAGIAAQDAGGVAPKDVIVTSENNEAPVFQAGEPKEWNIIVHNQASAALNDVVIAPKLGDTNDEWPFKTEWQDYAQKIGEIPGGESRTVTFTFEQREDAPTSRHKLQFEVYANDGSKTVQVVQNFYVNTTAKPEEKPAQSDDGGQISDRSSMIPEESLDLMTADAGGFSNGGVISDGGSGEKSSSVPRVIVTGFTTDPAEVRAGSNFVLTVHLKNTSKSTGVKNMLFDLNAPTEGSDEQTIAPAFLPSSGSSSVYLEGIKADEAADISIQLNAKADLLQKPYSVDLGMKYEDAEGSQIETASSLSIPVKQDARFEFSDFELSPESISVGDEANVMCSLYNLGRIKLYNVKATFEGACIKKEEVFVGNVESGASASIDAMLEGAQATEGPAKVTMTVSYEDEAGKIATSEKELQIEVTEAMDDEMMAGGMEMVEEEKGFPVLPVVAAAAVILVIVLVVVIRKRKKKKQRLNEEEELLNELDGPSEDER